MMKNNYGQKFYSDRHQKTVYSARTVLSIALDFLPEVNSAIDFGCGVGTWLSVLKEKSVREIQGLDGPWVEQALLEIPSENFRQIDFEEKINLDKKYDFAISLEVAEHLSEKTAGSFIDSLTAASDFILFSAAIPFQGGYDHVNEQWPDYWVDMFAMRGFVRLDFIRGRIWNDKQIPTWYRQNILLFVKKEEMHRVKVGKIDGYSNNVPISLVHPDLYLAKIDRMSSLIGSWRLFRHAVKEWIKMKIGHN